MIDPLGSAFVASSHGMIAQMTRMRVAAENLANANSTAAAPEQPPYLRKFVSFVGRQGSRDGQPSIGSLEIHEDSGAERKEFNPSHPAADSAGWVRVPLIDPFVEMADMREANRSYQANLQAYKSAREVFNLHIDLLRSR